MGGRTSAVVEALQILPDEIISLIATAKDKREASKKLRESGVEPSKRKGKGKRKDSGEDEEDEEEEGIEGEDEEVVKEEDVVLGVSIFPLLLSSCPLAESISLDISSLQESEEAQVRGYSPIA